MEVKLFEIRDRMTFFPVYCVALKPPFSTEEKYLIDRVGYNMWKRHVLYARLNGDDKALSDPYAWGDRTNLTAHRYILDNWTELKSGDVVDVEYILKETTGPKKSERITT